MKSTLPSITLIITTYLLIGFTCHAMDSDLLRKSAKNRKKTAQEILKSLHNAHTRNDEATFKTILFSKSPEELKPIIPQLQDITIYRTGQGLSKSESNPAFSKLLMSYAYAKKNNIHNQVLEAIRHEDLNKVSELVTVENVNLQNLIGETPLHIALRCNDLEIAQMLLTRKKADACLSNHSGETPLHMAECTEMVELLLQHQAPLNQQDIWGQTRLFTAILHNKPDVALTLIDKGADVNLSTMYDTTALHAATSHLPSDMALEVSKKLLAAGASINAQTCTNETPLWFAATNNLDQVVGLLLINGADATASSEGETAASIIQDKWGLTPEQFIELYKNPLKFSKYISELNKNRAQKSFAIELPQQKGTKSKSKGDKSKKKNKNYPTFNQRKIKAETEKSAAVAAKAPVIDLQPITSSPTPVLKQALPLILADRVTKWQNPEWLKLAKLNAKKEGIYQYWQFKRKRLYHQLPKKTLYTLLERGKPEPRPNKTYEGQMDTQYTLEGEMQFEYLTNPWNPGKQRQPGYYHITRGIDDKIYHVGFKPIQERGLRLSDFMAQGQIPVEWADIEASNYSAVYDPHEGVRHVLYTN